MKITIEIIKLKYKISTEVYVNGHWWKSIDTEHLPPAMPTISEILNCVEHSLVEEGVNFEEE